MSINYLVDIIDDDTTLSQGFRIVEPLHLYGIRLYMMKSDDLSDGTFTLTIKDGNTTIGSKSISYSDFNDEGSTLLGYFFFEFNIRLSGRQQDESYHEYTMELSSSSHTSSDSVFLGWVRNLEDTNLYGDNQTDGSPNTNYNYSYNYEILKI